MKHIAAIILVLSFCGTITLATSCQTGGASGELQNEGGSNPVNESELKDYKRAVLRCNKMGGTRVVKVRGKLLCY